MVAMGALSWLQKIVLPAIISLALILLLALLIPGRLGRQRSVEAELESPLVSEDTSGFRRAEPPAQIEFPRDHGPHPEYQTEWWYFTGNLGTEAGRHFGYQLTFFRRAISAPGISSPGKQRPSAWATEQVYMAHLALADIGAGDFYAYERMARGAAGLAGAQAAPFEVWLEDWRITEEAPDRFRLEAAQPLDEAGEQMLRLNLLLTPSKEPVLQGEQGYSQKGPDPGQASYYYSFTRLQTEGTVQAGGDQHPVSGLSWMDHEYSTSALSAGQVGWDWFALQLDDGSELMVFQIRREDGTVDPYSSGTFIAADGRTASLGREDFSIEVEDRWRSPVSGAEYPARWIIQVPGEELALEVEPYLSGQELNVSYNYWEGAVRVSGSRRGLPVSGSGYVELTGYAGSMGGEF